MFVELSCSRKQQLCVNFLVLFLNSLFCSVNALIVVNVFLFFSYHILHLYFFVVAVLLLALFKIMMVSGDSAKLVC